MWTDVIDLRDFYETAPGRLARRMIRRRLLRMWPDLRGRAVLGLGYATPYLRPWRDEAGRTLAFMPARLGVLHWPQEGPGLTALADEAELPLPDLSIDRVLCVHALEHTEQLRPMLREIWRVLGEAGRVVFVVPNRRGIWARTERTPFGHGHPYSAGQLSRLLRETMFTPMRAEGALYVPPMGSRMLMSAAPAWEAVGDRFLRRFAGVLLIEAGKQLYAPTRVRQERRLGRLYAALPRAVPAPRPAAGREA